MKSKWLTAGIILLFIGTSMIPSNGQQTEQSSLPPSRGDTLYVGGVGPGNYTRIQDAIDHTSDGDTVFVFNDSSPYIESLTINTKIILIGEDEASTIIKSLGYQRDVITLNVNYVSVHDFTLIYKDATAIRVLADNAVLTNLLVNGTGGSGTGINFHNAYNTFISQIVIERTQFGIITNYDEGTSHTTIEHCLLQDCRSHAIDMDSSDNIISNNTVFNHEYGIFLNGPRNKILNNTVMGGSPWGIYINNIDNIVRGNALTKTSFIISSGNTVSNNSVNGELFVYLNNSTNQTIENAGQIVLINCTNITIKNLEIGFCCQGIFLYQTTNSLIQNCTVFNSTEGVSLYYSTGITIRTSKMIDCGCGIKLYHGSNNAIDNNKVFGGGIVIVSTGTLISNNQVNASQIGIHLGESLFGLLIPTYRNNTIKQNTISDCKTGIFLEYCLHNTITQNNLMKNTKQATIYSSLLNDWTQNYWGQPMNHPKIIPGAFLIWVVILGYGELQFNINIPWINIDKHPAQEPYNIPEIR